MTLTPDTARPAGPSGAPDGAPGAARPRGAVVDRASRTGWDPSPEAAPPNAMEPGVVQSTGEKLLIGAFVGVPLLALLAAVPLAWNRWVGWTDLALLAVFYCLSGLGITVGYHRYFTHRAFKARRGLKVALGLAGSMAVQGEVLDWVADHRRHHAYSDSPGDPHSPWQYGRGPANLARGLLHAHVGWLFRQGQTSRRRYAPDLMADRDVVRLSRAFPLVVAAGLAAPAVLGGLLTWSWTGALTAFVWAGLVRVGLLHHVTWSVNSICHVWGRRPFRSRDESGNVAWLALPSFGESWHNLHHAEPSSARHGVLPHQVDLSARVIAGFERLGWATDVRWPRPERLEAKRIA